VKLELHHRVSIALPYPTIGQNLVAPRVHGVDDPMTKKEERLGTTNMLK